MSPEEKVQKLEAFVRVQRDQIRELEEEIRRLKAGAEGVPQPA